MARDELDLSLHRYLDGELEAAGRLRVEERLRSDPAFRTEYEAIRALDERLTGALRADPAQIARAEAAAAAVAKAGATRPVVPGPTSFWRRPGWAVAAALLILAVAIYASARALAPTAEHDPAIDGYLAQIAGLKAEVARLNARRLPFDPAPPLPTSVGPRRLAPGIAPEIAASPTGAVEQPVAKQPKAEVFSSIRDLLNEFGRTQKWDEARSWEILRQLHGRTDLTIEDFRELASLFRQQGPDTMGRLFLAQALGRNFMHLPQAREFVFNQVALAMQDLRATGGRSDRVLRRAWTDTLSHMRGDPRSIDYLQQIGKLDRDWLNRRNVLGGLANIGNGDSLTALADLAKHESQGYLKYEGLMYMRDLIYTDPTILRGADTSAITASLAEIVNGSFGESGDYWEAMVLALQLLRQLGFPDSELLKEQWRSRNLKERGGDPRGGNPLGLPFGDIR